MTEMRQKVVGRFHYQSNSRGLHCSSANQHALHKVGHNLQFGCLRLKYERSEYSIGIVEGKLCMAGMNWIESEELG